MSTFRDDGLRAALLAELSSIPGDGHAEGVVLVTSAAELHGAKSSTVRLV